MDSDAARVPEEIFPH
jgi:hypothetical protein